MKNSMAGVIDKLLSKNRVTRTAVKGEKQPSNSESEDFESLEYEEDVYYSNVTATPSFDDIDELDNDNESIVVHCWRGSNGDIEEIVVDDSSLCLDNEFLLQEADCDDSGKPRFPRSVKVIFQDFSKPYLDKISNSQKYKKILEMIKNHKGRNSCCLALGYTIYRFIF